MKVEYLKLYNAALNNAKDLKREAEILFENKAYARAYFLSYSALEEISKSQFAADVYTGFEKEEKFINFYRNHNKKMNRMKWAHLDANDSHYNLKWIGPGKDDMEQINVDAPKFKKRSESLYVDVDFNKNNILIPEKEISKDDAEGIIHIVDVALYQIWDMTENWGHQIGTKGFMK